MAFGLYTLLLWTWFFDYYFYIFLKEGACCEELLHLHIFLKYNDFQKRVETLICDQFLQLLLIVRDTTTHTLN